MKQYTLKQSNKILGVIDGDILRIIKTSENHYVRKYKGYGVGISTLENAEKAGAHTLELHAPNGEKFTLPIRDFRAAAIPDDLGSGRQAFLSVRWLRYYTQIEADRKKPQQLSFA